jgi:DNA-nicking Smr family endonuclease
MAALELLQQQLSQEEVEFQDLMDQFREIQEHEMKIQASLKRNQSKHSHKLKELDKVRGCNIFSCFEMYSI